MRTWRLLWLAILFVLASGCGADTPATPSSLGTACIPADIPVDMAGRRGFLPQNVYAEKAPECRGDPCLVYHLDHGVPLLPADPTEVCEEDGFKIGCVNRAVLEYSLYCSCRCGPEGDCECHGNYVCKEMAIGGLLASPQSYCVLKGT